MQVVHSISRVNVHQEKSKIVLSWNYIVHCIYKLFLFFKTMFMYIHIDHTHLFTSIIKQWL